MCIVVRGVLPGMMTIILLLVAVGMAIEAAVAGDAASDQHRPHRCYVCNGRDECSKLTTGDGSNRSSFEHDCPINATGCSAEIHNGTITARSCEQYSIDDCQNANAVQYCYCSRELCNEKFDVLVGANDGHITAANPFVPPPSDDEDQLEDAGSGAELPRTLDPQIEVKVKTGNRDHHDGTDGDGTKEYPKGPAQSGAGASRDCSMYAFIALYVAISLCYSN